MTHSHDIITLVSPGGAATADILVSLGFNCYSFRLRNSTRELDLLWAPESFATGQDRASSAGIPILFPFPGRIAGGSYNWQGKSYQLEENDRLGNAIHGFVHSRPWRLIERDEHRARAVFRSRDHQDELADRWPAEFELEADYSLSDQQLSTTYTVRNPDRVDLPFGLGLHPYFRLTKSVVDSAPPTLHCPVSSHWKLEGLIPTGESAVTETCEALCAGLRIDGADLDDVFRIVDVTDSQAWASIRNLTPTHDMVIQAHDRFQTCVVYTPPHGEAICVEPYTCLPNLFQVSKELPDLGPGIIRPGDSASFEVVYRFLESSSSSR